MAEVTFLSNGMRVVTDSVPTTESVSLGVWVNVGAKNETPDFHGASHFLEHMAFKGTHTRSAQQIADEIEFVGGYLNAYTSRDNTAYYVKLLKNDVEKGVDIISDILLNSTFIPEEFERERIVILQELYQSIDTPDDIIFDHFQEAAFGDTSFGRSILGTEESLESFTPEMIQGYMKSHYASDKMVFSFAGNIDHSHSLDLVNRFLDNVPNPKSESYAAPIFLGQEKTTLKDLEQAHMILGFEGCSYGHKDYYSSSILASILGGGMSSRLFQEVREKRGLVYSIFASSSPLQDTGIFQIYASSGEKTAHEVMPVICDVILSILNSISDEELQKSKNQLKASLLMALESSSHRSESKALQLINFNRLLSPEEVIQNIDSVTTQNVQNVMLKMLKSPLAISSLGPIKNLPDQVQIQERLAI